MKVIDLFSGLEGWAEPWRERGHEVFTVDIDPYFEPDLVADILEVQPRDLPPSPDVVLASPPCTLFSTAGWHQHAWEYRPWEEEPLKIYRPVTHASVQAVRIVRRTVALIEALRPQFFIIENPRGLLRKIGQIPYERREVWYCHYGLQRAKPTDLWGRFPKTWKPRPVCHRRLASHRDSQCCCRDHLASPRGSRNGTQGMDTAESAKIPEKLSRVLCRATEAYF